jgi:uncharacterized protein (TIGR02147 family)
MKKAGVYLSEKIFSYNDYRSYLTSVTEYWQERSLGSLRDLGKLAGFTSPSLLGEILAGRRVLTLMNAERFAKGISLTREATRYLQCLVIATHSRTTSQKFEAIEEMGRLIGIVRRIDIQDPSIHDTWLHSLLFELAKTRDFDANPANIRKKIRTNVPQADIESSINFLEHKKFIQRQESSKPVAANVEFKAINDLRRLNIQKKHLMFLQMAQHRLNDDLDEREFQGLTVAVKKEAMKVIKERLRDFIVSINEEVAEASEADDVVRIQLCAYKLTK